MTSPMPPPAGRSSATRKDAASRALPSTFRPTRTWAPRRRSPSSTTARYAARRIPPVEPTIEAASPLCRVPVAPQPVHLRAAAAARDADAGDVRDPSARGGQADEYGAHRGAVSSEQRDRVPRAGAGGRRRVPGAARSAAGCDARDRSAGRTAPDPVPASVRNATLGVARARRTDRVAGPGRDVAAGGAHALAAGARSARDSVRVAAGVRRSQTNARAERAGAAGDAGGGR